MGNKIKISFRDAGNRNSRGGAAQDMSASAQLSKLLIENYAQVKQAYLELPTAEDKSCFINVFEDFSEEEFLLGALRTNMMLTELEEWEAQEKLQALS